MSERPSVLTGDGISFFQLASLKGRLKLEIKGMKVSRGPTAYAFLKTVGFTGSRKSVLQQVEMLVDIYSLDGIEVHREHWSVAFKLVDMKRITLSAPHGPDDAWRRAEPCGKIL